MIRKIMAYVLILALLVGSINFAWESEISNAHSKVKKSTKRVRTFKKNSIPRPSVYVSGRGYITVKYKKLENYSSRARYAILRSKTNKKGSFVLVHKTRNKSSRVYDRIVRLNRKYYYKVGVYKIVKGKRVYINISKSRAVRNRLKYRKSFKVKAYAYTGGGRTASGKIAKVGRIAVDPRVIPLGTWLWVDGYGICQACDTGGGIKGRVVDLYMKSRSACFRWGVRYPKVYILR